MQELSFNYLLKSEAMGIWETINLFGHMEDY